MNGLKINSVISFKHPKKKSKTFTGKITAINEAKNEVEVEIFPILGSKEKQLIKVAVPEKNIKAVLDTYFNKYYDVNDDKETWFNKMKEACEEMGFCSNMKLYKENPDNYKGNVADVSTVIRVSLTTRSMTPDLYELLKLLEKEKIKERFNLI